jgi:hypothetical protein
MRVAVWVASEERLDDLCDLSGELFMQRELAREIQTLRTPEIAAKSRPLAKVSAGGARAAIAVGDRADAWNGH